MALHLNTSRRKADELILKNKIKVNNKLAVLGQEIITSDIISYNGKILPSDVMYKYYKFYKPIGYVCSTKTQGQSKTIYEIVKDYSLKYSGRLDKDSEGLMLLSNDGDWLNSLNHPSNEVMKEYVVTLYESIEVNSFKKKVVDRGETLKIDSIVKKNQLEYRVALTTGKNREIRRIFSKNKLEIKNLKRISIGSYKLGKLKIGELSEIKSI